MDTGGYEHGSRSGAHTDPPGGSLPGQRIPRRRKGCSGQSFRVENGNPGDQRRAKVFGTAGYSRARPLKRMVRDLHMFTIGGGTAQIHLTQVVSSILGKRLPQTRNGHV